jgi:hypothetical protein
MAGMEGFGSGGGLIEVLFRYFSKFLRKTTKNLSKDGRCVNWDISVGKAAGYGLDNRGTGFQFPLGTRDISVLHSAQTGFESHPASHTVGTEGSYPGGKEAET